MSKFRPGHRRAAVVGACIVGLATATACSNGDGQPRAQGTPTTATSPKAPTSTTAAGIAGNQSSSVNQSSSINQSSSVSGGSVVNQSLNSVNGRTEGVITVTARATLDWTNDGRRFQIFDQGQKALVDSAEPGGSTVLEPGTYRVSAEGNVSVTTKAK